MSSSKAVLSYYNYSHTYELEYNYCVMILIYGLVQSLCVMRVAHLTLCLNNHITYIIKIRAKLRGLEGIWVVSVYASVVLMYGETGECIVPLRLRSRR